MSAAFAASQSIRILHDNFSFNVLDLGCVEYHYGLTLQRSLVDDIRFGRKESTVVLCEHNPVITLGRQAKKENILQSLDKVMARGVDIVKCNRAGDVTLHLPGQLVVYPIFDLKLLGKDIHLFLRNLEQTVIVLLQGFGIAAGRKEGLTGAWVGDRKIASMGIALSHWISSHGLSLNVNCDLRLFSLIRPCGRDIMVTSIAQELTQCPLEMNRVKENIVIAFREVFGRGGY